MIPQFSIPDLPSRHIQTPGARIHARTLGEGPPLALLHGLSSSSADWLPIAPSLATDYRLLLLDMRGHGQSSLATEGGYAISRMAADVAVVLDAFEIDRAHFLGLSLGGCVAMQFAVDYPARVQRLVLVNTFARLQSTGIRSLRQRLTRIYAALHDMDQLARYVATSLFDDPEYQRITYERMRHNDLGAIRRTMIALMRFNLLDQLHRIQAPTLVLVGDRDKTVPLRCATDMMARLPSAQMRVIADAGHALPYDQPEAFVDAVLDFLARP
ncbi:MAG TPA: alpha/beta fold hydrolase [Caldilineae bacterium]|nr:alpha/beta fold hydrolase [Caldilineae bacterium]